MSNKTTDRFLTGVIIAIVLWVVCVGIGEAVEAVDNDVSVLAATTPILERMEEGYYLLAVAGMSIEDIIEERKEVKKRIRDLSNMEGLDFFPNTEISNFMPLAPGRCGVWYEGVYHNGGCFTYINGGDKVQVLASPQMERDLQRVVQRELNRCKIRYEAMDRAIERAEKAATGNDKEAD
ncbi:MAG: hypothetical protein GY832_22280 [Chloroflexi bacterium]|nr:hypothetical protein [Chloroflexota bacterium]